jgi:uncharacterized protein (UPF0297 family)
MKIENQSIESSNLKTLTYDSEDQNLIIEFKGKENNRYQYKNVPEELVENFLKSESKGKFFHSDIKGKYEFKKISNQQEKEFEEATKKVYNFLDQNSYNGEKTISQIEKKGNDIFVSMLNPYGLFIVSENGTVQDNYGVFDK